MAGVEQMDFSVRQIAAERLSPCRDERGIVPSPDHQGRGFVLAQPRLPCGIGSDIRAVLVEQVRLDLVLTRSQ